MVEQWHHCIFLSVHMCVCVCVCARARAREREREMFHDKVVSGKSFNRPFLLVNH